ncbi:MAG: hypothetical protein WEB63_09905 [Cucumibacter sp.]
MGTPRKLDADIVALVHHIELNQTGWIDHALVRVVRFSVWMAGGEASSQEVLQQLHSIGLNHLSATAIDSALQVLVAQGDVLERNQDKFALSEACRKTTEAAVDDAENTEKWVRDKVWSAAQATGGVGESLDEDQLWNEFRSRFIIPFISGFGARAYELVSGSASDTNAPSINSEVSARLPNVSQEATKAMVLALLDRSDAQCRTYVLRQLNGYFFQAASSLPEATKQRLFGQHKAGRQLRLVLDTNFLFSLFGLHANPANEAVEMLLEVIKQIQAALPIGLYVLPTTIHEFRMALTHYEQQAAQIRTTANVVRAGLQHRLSGVFERYLQLCKDSSYKINAKDYFEPYHTNTTRLLKEKGVHILRDVTDGYAANQSAVDDLHDQTEFLKNKFPGQPSRQRTHDSIWHDIVLWYCVRDRRPPGGDTIFEADWVGVTIDYALIAFDAYKRRRRGMPLVVHPAALLQALKVILPGDVALEDTILSLMRMPFLGEEFEVEDEKVTHKILSIISRYEDVEDISVESISEILLDKLLRGKIETAHDQDEELTLVKEAFIIHTRELEQKKSLVEGRLQEHEDRVSELTEKVESLTDDVVSTTSQSEYDIQRTRVGFGVAVASLAWVSVTLILALYAGVVEATLGRYANGGLMLLAFALCLKGLDCHVAKQTRVANDRLPIAIRISSRLFWWFVVFGITALAGPALYDGWKASLPAA